MSGAIENLEDISKCAALITKEDSYDFSVNMLRQCYVVLDLQPPWDSKNQLHLS